MVEVGCRLRSDAMDEAAKIAQERIDEVISSDSPRGASGISPRSKWTAVLVAVMAAVLAIADINAHHSMKTVINGENSIGVLETKLDALDNHRILLLNDVTLIETLGQNGQSAAVQQRRRTAELTNAKEAKSLASEESGLKANVASLRRETSKADSSYEYLEVAIGALQIGIVLASISIVAGAFWLLVGGAAAGLLGLVMTVYALFFI